jgi:hypothetical protein
MSAMGRKRRFLASALGRKLVQTNIKSWGLLTLTKGVRALAVDVTINMVISLETSVETSHLETKTSAIAFILALRVIFFQIEKYPYRKYPLKSTHFAGYLRGYHFFNYNYILSFRAFTFYKRILSFNLFSNLKNSYSAGNLNGNFIFGNHRVLLCIDT